MLEDGHLKKRRVRVRVPVHGPLEVMGIKWTSVTALLITVWIGVSSSGCGCPAMVSITFSFRSILTYSRIGGRVKTLTFCQGSHYLAIASDNGAVQLLGIEASKLPKSPKIHPLQSRYHLPSFYLYIEYTVG